MVKPRWSLLGLLIAACDTGFPLETVVENLRVLGIRSVPADLHPGEQAVVESLILDPQLSGRRPSVLWVGCAPDPFNLNRSACSDPSLLKDPTSLSPAGELPEGVQIIGFNDHATFAVSRDVFSALPADDARRISGTVGQVLAIAVSQEVSAAASPEELRALFARVQAKEVDSLIALFRIRISEDPQRNQNPLIDTFTVNGARLSVGATVGVLPGQKLTLDVSVTDEAFESYTTTTPAGVEQRAERLLAAWYSSTGRYSEERTALREAVKTVFTGPGVERDDPIPEGRTGTLYVTLRDTRGGQTWHTAPLFVCDAHLPEPVISAARWADGLVLEGEHLEQLLDVVINGRALKGQHDPSTRRWAAPAPKPALTAGDWPLTFFTKRCTTPASLSVTVP